MDEKMYTNKELAEKYNVTLGCVFRWTNKRLLMPTVKIGRTNYYSEEDVKKFEQRYINKHGMDFFKKMQPR